MRCFLEFFNILLEALPGQCITFKSRPILLIFSWHFAHGKRLQNRIIKENWGPDYVLTVHVTLHALSNQVISPRLVLSLVMTPYWPLICFLSTAQESVIPSIPEQSLCSPSMTFNLSLHQSMSLSKTVLGQGGRGERYLSHT